MNLGGCTATGPREANEDSFFTFDFSDVNSFANGVVAFAMVSDGMGGYQGGDVASGLAVSSAESYLHHLLDMADGNQVDLDAQAALAEIVQNAHDAIEVETRNRNNARMGATFVGAFISPRHAWIGHVGDSRAYLVRDGRATQLTQDHSQVGRMLSEGLITEEEAQNHPARNRIERALGFTDGQPDPTEVDLMPGDALVMCSDGVYTVLDGAAICKYVKAAAGAEDAARRIVKAAVSHGTDDNSTAVVVFVEKDRPSRGEHAAAEAQSQRAPRQGTQPLPVQNAARTQVLPPQAVRAQAGRAAHAGHARSKQADSMSAGGTRVLPANSAAARGRTSKHVASEGSRARRTRSSRPAATYIVPIVVALLLVAVIAFLFFAAPGREGVMGGASGAAPAAPAASGAPANGTAPTGADASAGAPTAPGQAPESGAGGNAQTPAAGGYQSYATLSDAELKFVDASGVAQSFDEEPLYLDTAPALRVGAQLQASAASENHGRNFDYRTLPNDYLADLRADCADYESGVRAFDSRLSQLVDPDLYPSFLGALANSGAVNDIEALAIRADALSDPTTTNTPISPKPQEEGQ